MSANSLIPAPRTANIAGAVTICRSLAIGPVDDIRLAIANLRSTETDPASLVLTPGTYTVFGDEPVELTSGLTITGGGDVVVIANFDGSACGTVNLTGFTLKSNNKTIPVLNFAGGDVVLSCTLRNMTILNYGDGNMNANVSVVTHADKPGSISFEDVCNIDGPINHSTTACYMLLASKSCGTYTQYGILSVGVGSAASPTSASINFVSPGAVNFAGKLFVTAVIKISREDVANPAANFDIKHIDSKLQGLIMNAGLAVLMGAPERLNIWLHKIVVRRSTTTNVSPIYLSDATYTNPITDMPETSSLTIGTVLSVGKEITANAATNVVARGYAETTVPWAPTA